MDTIQDKAKQISEGYGHFYVGTEHLFLAVLLEEPFLADVLSDWQVYHGPFVERILEIAERGEGKPLWSGFPVTPRLQRCLQAAQQAAAGAPLPHHLVAAILADGNALPSRVLREMGVDLRALRSDVQERARSARPNGAARPEGRQMIAGSQKGMQKNEAPLDLADILGVGQDKKAASAAEPEPKAPRPEAPAKKEDRDKKKSALAEYAQNLTQMAKDGKLPPVIGRQEEIRRCLEILTRKGKNNPVLIGEAGVGKTSVAVGIAQRIAAGRVPELMHNKEIWELSLTRLIAGAAYRGEFQERLQKLMDEVAERPEVVLFIDEIHTLVGAGDHKGGMDASNVLKPALARGDFPVIGATTTDEYRKAIEADPALERRFLPVLVPEPSEKECLAILEGLRQRYEEHHGVKIHDKALLAAVKLSMRFLPDRSLPDKAIDLVDEAAAKVKLKGYSFSISPDVAPEFVVREENVAEVVSLWSGVPVTRLTAEESERLLHIEDELRARVIGQEEAVRSVAQTIRVMRSGLGNPNRPAGVFLFLGPTGVGKTELARALAEFLFGSEKDMVRIDMSEYMEKHAISRLIGSPPGYVGHEEEGQLTKQVRTRPYSVVLLDEIEKAHPDVFLLFLQVFDDGRLTDSKGRTVNFTNTIIIMTSNIGARAEGAPGDPDDPEFVESVMEALRKKFPPEFINRIDENVIFRPLDRAALERIVDLQITDVTKRVRESKGVMLAVEPGARELLLEKGYSLSYGARPLKRAVQTLLVKPLAEEMLRTRFEVGDLVVAGRDGNRIVFHKQDLSAASDAPEPAARTSPPPERNSRNELGRQIVDVPSAPPGLVSKTHHQDEDEAPPAPRSFRPYEGSGSRKRPAEPRPGGGGEERPWWEEFDNS